MDALVRWIDSNPDKVAAHLPDGWSVDQTRRSVLALKLADDANGGKIAECDPGSVVLAVLQAASFGLGIDNGDAYVIPYKKRATLSVSYKGLIKLAKRSGEARHVVAEVVYSGEHFRVWSSDGIRRYEHTLNVPRSEGEVVAAYVSIVNHDGFCDLELMDRAEIEKVQEASKDKMGGKTSPAWKTWFGEMAKKAVIRRALKRYTLSPELDRVFQHEDELFFSPIQTTAAVVSLNDRFGVKRGEFAGLLEDATAEDGDAVEGAANA